MTHRISELLESYKTLIKKNGLSDEKYKWQFIRDYKGKPDLSNDMETEIANIKFPNLIYHMSAATLKRMATEKGNDLKKVFAEIRDESVSLDARVAAFTKDMAKVYNSTSGQNSPQQDERSMSLYLTLSSPEKYTFYKSSYYLSYCDYMGIKPSGARKKFSHYMEIVRELSENYISKDAELLSLVQSELGDFANEDPNMLLLAQDMLYQTARDRDGLKYWVFQGNPKIYDFTGAIENDAVHDWSVSAHKDKIEIGDKIILWITGANAGCYALAEVTSEIKDRAENEEDDFWKEEDKIQQLVEINITHNLSKNPVLKEEIDQIAALKDLKVGSQGTNFSATKEEYEAILELIEGNSETTFNEVVKLFQKDKYDAFIETLKKIVAVNSLTRADERIAFSVVDKKRLCLIIGSRYSFMIEQKKKTTYYAFVSQNKLGELSTEFTDYTGKNRAAYWNTVKDIDKFEEEIINGCSFELNRNYKSPHHKRSNEQFMDVVFGKEERSSEVNESQLAYGMKSKGSLNQILYGPPGTGKTYTLKQDYFPKYTLREASLTKEMFFEETVRDLTWWQVIGLALLEIGTSKVSDILANRWVSEKARLSESKNVRATLWGTLQMHTIQESNTVAYKQRQVPLIFDKTEDKAWQLFENELQEQFPELYDIRDSVNKFAPNPHKEIKHYVFTTFHQSFAYEDFIEGIKPKLNTEAGDAEVSYQIENGVFKALCIRAQSDPDNRYAIFIDEINRGNVSAIFGELITLIESDKRLGAEHEIKVRLPYSKTDFGVPSNVDIYGTMNTADRSVEALDTALRRRFSFVEVMPKPSLLKDIEFKGFMLKEVLQTINERIAFLLDRDHTIGHSYFMQLQSGDTEGLKAIFKNKVIPLLQEYFYHDYEKIALILGSGFVKVTTNHAIRFEKIDGIAEPDNVTLCELVDDIVDIEDAIGILLNRKE